MKAYARPVGRLTPTIALENVGRITLILADDRERFQGQKPNAIPRTPCLSPPKMTAILKMPLLHNLPLPWLILRNAPLPLVWPW